MLAVGSALGVLPRKVSVPIQTLWTNPWAETYGAASRGRRRTVLRRIVAVVGREKRGRELEKREVSGSHSDTNKSGYTQGGWRG
jgi:hypothetical protein